MRLMLGFRNNGHEGLYLLVSVDDTYDPLDFKFFVVNGNWPGRFVNGDITIDGGMPNSGAVSTGVSILCDNQDRLRGAFADVFANYNYSNVDYIAPN